MTGFTAVPRWTSNPVPGLGEHTVRIPTRIMAALRRLASDLAVPLSSVLLTAHAKVLGALAGEPLPPGTWRDAVLATARHEPGSGEPRGEIYSLDILAENIEDEAHNTTRFVILAREPKWAAQNSGHLVTTFVFNVRNVPAALYKAMGGFATNGVNMTKLESYMVDGNFFATQFYADVDGHPDDRSLAFALEELKFFSKEFRIIGVYPAHQFRETFAAE